MVYSIYIGNLLTPIPSFEIPERDRKKKMKELGYTIVYYDTISI